MKAANRKVVLNLLDRFQETVAFQRGDRLIPETECLLGVGPDSKGEIRQPDLAYFTLGQIRDSETRNPIPSWMIEIAEPTDRFFLMEDKVTEYFQSGVQVVWEIFPPYERVRIFRPVQETLELTGEDLCIAEPVLEEFHISIPELFKAR